MLSLGLPFLFLLLRSFVHAQESSSYDYIICGGGTTGLALANRLTENPSIRVLVIEAGRNISNYNTTGQSDDILWDYVSTPQTYASERVIKLRAGRLTGGSSQINGRAYSRPEATSIDIWGQVNGGNWSWDALLPFYKSSEALTPPTSIQQSAGIQINPSFHGFNGLVDVNYAPVPAPRKYLETYQQAAAQFDIPAIPDPNVGNVRGLSILPRTVKLTPNGTKTVRESSREAYYLPFVERGNLELVAEMSCLKLEWGDRKNGSGLLLMARGVQIAAAGGGEIRIVYASREVILSAGAYRSSTILEFSGVGNRDILSSHGIETLVDLPGVGENLQDQTQSNVSFQMADSVRESLSNDTDASFVFFLDYRDIFGSEADSIRDQVNASLPSYAGQISSHINGALPPEAILQQLEIQYRAIFDLSTPSVELLGGLGVLRNTIHLQHWNLIPLSRGNVHISGPDPQIDGPNPTIDPNFFALDYDWSTYINTSRFLRRLLNTPPISYLHTYERVPGLSAVPENASDEIWKEYWLPKFTNEWHPIGSCAMLPREWGGVVDSDLRVYGTGNVRVMDASVMPFNMGGHPTSTLYVVAERMGSVMERGESLVG